MSDKLTSIDLPGVGGRLEWGVLEAPEAIARCRRFYEYQLAQAQAILAAPDAAFRVTIVKGTQKQKRLRTIQEPSPEDPAHDRP